MSQVYVRRSPQGQVEVEVESESMSDSPSRQLVAEMMIMAGEVIGDLGVWPISPAPAPAPATICTSAHCVQCARSTMRAAGCVSVGASPCGVTRLVLLSRNFWGIACRHQGGSAAALPGAGSARAAERRGAGRAAARPVPAGQWDATSKTQRVATQEFRASLLGSPCPHFLRVASLHCSTAGRGPSHLKSPLVFQ